MLLILEHLQDAVQSLRSTRTRTLLTALGVAIGVASITTILALSGGIMNVISGQVSSLDGNIALVRPGPPVSTTQVSLTTPVSQQMFGTSTLTEQDVDTISKIENVEAVAPLMVITGSLKAEDATVRDGLVVATSPSLAEISGMAVRDGQFIDSVTNPNTAVLGAQLAVNLFGTDRPIGQTFTIRGQLFTVIGVLKRLEDPINFNAIDFDNAAIIDMEAGKTFHHGKSQIQQIDVRATSTAAIPAVTKEINEQLMKSHGGEQDFTVVSGDDIAKPTNQLFIAVAGVMTVIATISLVVGGIGIMNIMLVGVAERTREIGLRKAIGASNRNILEQFLTESLMVSLAGGLLGFGAGYALAFAAGRLLSFTPIFSWEIAAVALGMSVIVGVIFGLYPAIRAARKDPIESLRQYH